MLKLLKSLFENKKEHRCQLCGEIYTGVGSFTSSESCTYSHENDTLEQELRYPKNLRKIFHERKNNGETRNQFIFLLISSWKKDKVLNEDNNFFNNVSKTYLPTGIYYDLNNNEENILNINLDNEAHYIYEKLDQKAVL